MQNNASMVVYGVFFVKRNEKPEELIYNYVIPFWRYYMKKIFIVLFLSLFLISGVFAQVTYDELKTSFSAFSADVSEALPFASTTGLQWSNAYMGGFPHFGVGLSVGAVTIPEKAFNDLAGTMGFTLPAELTSLGIGVPLPGYTLDARMGLPFLPLDVGVKLGMIPPGTIDQAKTGVGVDYTLAGVDVRFPVIKQNLVLPAVSLGVGFNYLSSTVSTTATGLGTSMDLSLVDSSLKTLTFNNPDVAFAMETKTVDAKLQVSKSLLIFTPYVGVGYAYGWSTAGGGMLADILYDGSPITQSDIDTINQKLQEKGQTPLDLSSTQVLITSDNTGGAFRAFGGVSINILILKIDLSAMYNVNTKSLGANLNTRISF